MISFYCNTFSNISKTVISTMQIETSSIRFLPAGSHSPKSYCRRPLSALGRYLKMPLPRAAFRLAHRLDCECRFRVSSCCWGKRMIRFRSYRANVRIYSHLCQHHHHFLSALLCGQHSAGCFTHLTPLDHPKHTMRSGIIPFTDEGKEADGGWTAGHRASEW